MKIKTFVLFFTASIIGYLSTNNEILRFILFLFPIGTIFYFLKKIKQIQAASALREKTDKEALFYRDEFISVTSHELRTPLTSLKLHCQIYRRAVRRGESDARGPERMDALIDKIDQQLERINKLVDEMLDISRIRAGKFYLNPERLCLLGLLQEVLNSLEPQFKKSGLERPKIEASGSFVAQADRTRVQQVFNHLLSNCLRYGDKKPIEIHFKENVRDVHISIIDRGIGIPDDFHDKIFQRFQRAVPASEVSGLGLGLYLSKQIIEAHGGRIGVDSALGQGSRFWFELPLIQ
jgi:signal transduction histidine kinase